MTWVLNARLREGRRDDWQWTAPLLSTLGERARARRAELLVVVRSDRPQLGHFARLQQLHSGYAPGVYAAMSIRHKPGDAVDALKKALNQPNRPSALTQSTFPGASALTGHVKYTAATPSWIVFCPASVSNHLQLVVEARHGSLKSVCEMVWGAFSHTAKELKPRLEELKLIDPISGTEPLAVGRTGMRPLLGRTDIRLALWPGFVTGAVLVAIWRLEALTGTDYLNAAMAGAPAVIVSLVALALLLLASLRRGLVWDG